MIAPTLAAADYRAAWNPTEAEFQQSVIEAAQQFGWLCVHFRQMVGNPAGWPDLIMIHGGTVLFVELKRENGTLSQRQAEWGERLEEAGADVRLWRPSMWDEIIAILSGEATNDHG